MTHALTSKGGRYLFFRRKTILVKIILLICTKYIDRQGIYNVAGNVAVLVLLLLTFCLMLLPLWESVILLCFVVHYCMSIIVLQSS